MSLFSLSLIIFTILMSKPSTVTSLFCYKCDEVIDGSYFFGNCSIEASEKFECEEENDTKCVYLVMNCKWNIFFFSKSDVKQIWITFPQQLPSNNVTNDDPVPPPNIAWYKIGFTNVSNVRQIFVIPGVVLLVLA